MEKGNNVGVVQEQPPFDVAIHLKSKIPTDPQILSKLKQRLQGDNEYCSIVEAYPEAITWCSDMQLIRFLAARQNDPEAAAKLLISALEWRERRRPEQVEKRHDFEQVFGRQGATGKVYCPGQDKWGRPVLVFDNTVENMVDIDERIQNLAWNVEFACRQMPPTVDKFVIFMHLTNFSFFNTPPMSVVKETIHMMCKCYPERLGHCIVFQAPGMFSALWTAVKGFIDQRTTSKMIFISGDVSDGSQNDVRLSAILGKDWKQLTGTEQPVYEAKSSPGYRHDVFRLTPALHASDALTHAFVYAAKSSPGYRHDIYWPNAMRRLRDIQAAEAAARAVMSAGPQ